MKNIFLVIILILHFSSYGQTNKTLDNISSILETVYNTDQSNRLIIDSIISVYGANSKEIDSLNKVINHQDSLNQEQIITIIERYGWLVDKPF